MFPKCHGKYRDCIRACLGNGHWVRSASLQWIIHEFNYVFWMSPKAIVSSKLCCIIHGLWFVGTWLCWYVWCDMLSSAQAFFTSHLVSDLPSLVKTPNKLAAGAQSWLVSEPWAMGGRPSLCGSCTSLSVCTLTSCAVFQSLHAISQQYQRYCLLSETAPVGD